ncbi:MAG TPA: acetyl-CoA hydrolase/transferase C-terminal domain-containing protein [Spongiibacteraceae bacterium]|nr:acetyl-CoA hydrolase/transferase C-terminal domain-containing protein [Spongiibacteraceae bacterium]
MMQELTAAALDLSRYIRAGDTVFVGQGTAEALTLTEALTAQRAQIGAVKVFLGPTFSQTWQPEHADYLTFLSYGALGNNQQLAQAGLLNVIPSHMSQLPQLIDSGTLPADVVLIQLSPPNARGEYSFGIANDYLVAAMRRARVVIAEVNDQVPWTYCDRAGSGSTALAQLRIDYLVRTSRPLLELKGAAIGATEQRIAAFAAEFIGDGAVLQTGIGAIPDAILSALGERRDLGVHSGLIGDCVIDLIRRGVMNGARKNIDRDLAVGGVVFASESSYRFLHENAQVLLQPVTHTHDLQTIAALDNFIAINSAIEVDLTGQVNAEMAGANYIGAVGGQLDFVRGAWAARGGRSIIALPATAKNASISRIVARIDNGNVTTPRSDADLIVTEWGAAELRGQTLAERMRRMIAIAHPDFREGLERAAHAQIKNL